MNYETDQEKVALLKHIYFKQKMASGRDSIWHYIRDVLHITSVSRRFVAKWLAKQESQQLYTQPKPKTRIRTIISSRPAGIIQIDLIDFSNRTFQGFNYILNVIDVFSRKCWLKALKNKEAKTIDANLKLIIDEIQKTHKKKISVIQSDQGNEFVNVGKIDGIKYIQSQSRTPQAQGVVERSNQSIKRILNKVLHNESSKNFVKYLPEIQEAYNNGYNRILKMSPNVAFESTDEEQNKLHSQNLAEKAKSFKEVNTLLSVNDNVRLIIPETLRKKGQPNYSTEIYKITKVIKENGLSTIPQYKVANLKGYYAISKLLYIPTVETSPQIPKVVLIRPKTTRQGTVY